MHCSSAVNIVDLCGYALQNLVAMHSCPTFLHAVCLPPLLLATSVRTARLLSTSSNFVRLQSFFGTHYCPTFVHATRMPSTSLTCVRVLQNLVGTCCCPTFVRAARIPSTPLTCVRTHCRASLVPLLFYIRTCCVFAAIAAGYIHTRCSSAVYIIDLRLLAELLWYPLLSYIRTRCSSAVNIVDLSGYTLLNLVTTYDCPTFLPAASQMPLPLATSVHTAHLLSTSSTSIRCHESDAAGS